MSRQEKSVEVIRRELNEVVVCDGCGLEAKEIPPGMYAPTGWYRLGYDIHAVDACSSVCARELLEKFSLAGAVR